MADVQAVNIWTGTEWVEIAQPIADGGNVGDVLTWSGSEWSAAAPGGLPIGTAEGQILQWDGAGWNPASEGTVDGQLLAWDSLNARWTPMVYTGTDGNGKPIKPILPIGSEDGTVMLADYAGSFSVQDTSVANSPDPIATFHPDSKPQMAGMMLKQSWLGQDGKVMMWEPGTSREPVVPTEDAQAVPKKYVDDQIAAKVADHHLPIDSADGTVRLESPSAGTFTLWTNSQECLRVNGTGNTIVEHGLIVDDWARVGGATDGFSYGNYAAGGATWFGHYVVPPSNTAAAATDTYACWRSTPLPGNSVIVNGYGFWVAMNSQTGASRYQIYCPGTAPSYLGTTLIASGSALLPSLSFLGDTDTGMYRVGPDSIGFATAGQYRFSITSAGMLKTYASYEPVADEDLANKGYVDYQIRANGGTIQTTADLPLANPQDNTFLRFNPQGTFLTQEDANLAFVQGLTDRKVVLPISAVDYDALADKDPDTLYLIVS